MSSLVSLAAPLFVEKLKLVNTAIYALRSKLEIERIYIYEFI